MTKLTPYQEKFALKFIELGNASEAYRQSYNPENSADKTIWENACRTLADSKVSARVFELQQAAAERNEITVDDLVKEYEEARELAKEEKQAASMVSATSGKSKILGFDKTNIDLNAKITTIADTLANMDEPSTDEITGE